MLHSYPLLAVLRFAKCYEESYLTDAMVRRDQQLAQVIVGIEPEPTSWARWPKVRYREGQRHVSGAAE